MDGESAADVLKVLVTTAGRGEFVPQGAVGALLDPVQLRADVVHDGHDAGRRLLLLDELAHDGVVEVFDRRPGDALLHVFLLRGGRTYEGQNF